MQPSNKEAVFSDDKLSEFHSEFKDHVQQCTQRFDEGDAQFKLLMEAQRKNTEVITCLVTETREVIRLHRDWKGFTRIGGAAQRAWLWLAKWGAIGAGFALAWAWGVDFIQEWFK